jgi:hypothetical protein
LRDPRLPLPGTLLARDFKGRDIVVKVLDNGFLFFGLADGGTAQSGNRNTKRRNEQNQYPMGSGTCPEKRGSSDIHQTFDISFRLH